MKKLALSYLSLVFKAWSKGRLGRILRRNVVTVLTVTTVTWSSAATVDWEGGTGGTPGDALNWLDPLNWQGDALPANADDITFGAAGTANSTVNLNTDRTVNSLGFDENMTLGALGSNLTLTNTSGNITVTSGDFAQINAALGGNNGINLSGGGSLYLTNPLSLFNGGITVSGAGTTLVHRQEGPSVQYNAINGAQEFGRFDQVTLGYNTAVRNITLTNGGTYRILQTGNNSEGSFKNIIIGAGGGTLDLAAGYIVQNLDDTGQITATTNEFTKAGKGRLIITGTMATVNPLGGVVNVNGGMLSLDNQASQLVGANTYVRFLGIAGTGTTLNLNAGGTIMINNGTQATLDTPTINANNGSIIAVNGQDHIIGFSAGGTTLNVNGTATILARDLFGPQTARQPRLRADLAGSGTLDIYGNTNAGGTPRLFIERGSGSTFSGTFRLNENTMLTASPTFNPTAEVGKVLADGDIEFAGWGSTLDLRDSDPAAASVKDYTTNEITITTTQAGALNTIAPIRAATATGTGHLFNFGTLTMGNHRLAIAGNNSYQTGFADTASIRGDAVMIMNADAGFAVFSNPVAMAEDAAGRSFTVLKAGTSTTAARDVIVGGTTNVSNINVATGTLQLRGAVGAIGTGFGGAAPVVTVNGAGIAANGNTLPSAGLLHLDSNTGHVVGTTTVFAAANNNNRIVDSATLNMRSNSTLRLTSLLDNQTTETIGTTNVFGHASFDVVKSGTAPAPVALTLGGLTRGANATVNFSGTTLGTTGTNTSRIVIPGTATGFMPAAFHQNNEWAKYNATVDNGFDVGVTPFVAGDYTTGTAETTWAAGQQIKQTAGSTLTGNRTADRFNFQTGANQTVNLAGFKLTAAEGGIIQSAALMGFKDGGAGAAPSATAGVTAGTTASAASLYVHTSNTVEFHTPITDNAAGGSVTFVKSGTGTVTLSHQGRTVGQAQLGAAPFTGTTWSSTNTGGWVINDGMLNVHRGQYLGATPTTVTLNGGQLEINEPASNANADSIIPGWGHHIVVNGNAMIGFDDNGESNDGNTGDRTLVKFGSLTVNNGSLLGMAAFSDNDIAFMGGASLNGRPALQVGAGGRSGVNNANILSGVVSGGGFDVVALGGNGATLVIGGTSSDNTHNTYNGQVALYGGTIRLNKANGFTAITDGAASEDVVINGANLFWGPGHHGNLSTTNNVNTTNNGILGLHPFSSATTLLAGQNQIADNATITLLTGTLGESDRITNEKFGTLIMKNGTLNVGLGTLEVDTATISGGAIGFDRGGTWKVGSLTYLPGAPDQNIFTGKPVPGAYTTVEVGPGGLNMTGQFMTLGSGFYNNNVMGAGGRLVLGGNVTFNGTDLIGGSYGRKGIYIQTGASFRELGDSHVDLAGGARNFNIGTDSIFTITAPIRNGSITKSGGGSLVLEPYQASSFSGVTVNGGMVVAKGDGALGSGAGNIVVNSGGTLKLETGWSYANSFSVAGRGSNVPGDANVFEYGAVVADGGTSRLRGSFALTGNATIAGTNFLDPSVAPGVGGEAWRVGRLHIESPTGITGTGALTLSGNGDGVVLNGIKTTAGGVNKDGSGRWTVGGPSTYIGTTTIAAGNLRITDSTSLGSPLAGTVVTGGALELAGNGINSPEPLRLNGAGSSLQSGAVVNVSGTNTLSGAVILNSSSTIRSEAGSSLQVALTSSVTGTPNSALTLSGAGAGNIMAPVTLSVPGGDAVIKAGTGNWVLGHGVGNAFTGSVRADGGLLTVFSGWDTTRPLRMNGGSVQNMLAGASVNGTNLLSGGGTVSTFPNFNLGLITASPGATGNFTGVLSASNANVNGIIGAWATNSMLGGPEWSKTNAGLLQPLLPGDYSSFPVPATAGGAATISNTLNTSYGYDANGFSSSVTGSLGTNTLRVVPGLKGLQTSAASVTLGAGGLLVQQNAGSTFNIGGTGLIAGPNASTDLYIQAWGDTAISNPLIGAGTGSLVKSGTGDLRLFGTSNFTGSVYINGGNIIVPGPVNTPGPLGAAGGANNRLININGGGLGIIGDWDLNDWDAAAGVQSYQFNIGPAGGTLRTLYGSTLNINDGSATTAGADQQLQGSGDLTFAGGGRYNLTGGTPQFLRFTGNVNVDTGVLMVGHSNSLGGRQEQVITMQPGSAILNGAAFGLGQNGLPNNIVVPNGGVEFYTLGSPRTYGGDIQLAGRNTIYLAERDAGNTERPVFFNGRVSGSGVTLDVFGGNNAQAFTLASGANDLTGTINLNTNAVLEVRQPGSLGSPAGNVNVNLNGTNSRLLLRHWQNGDYFANVNVGAAAEISADRLTGYGGGTSHLLSINNLTTTSNGILSIGGGNGYNTWVKGTATFNANTPVNATNNLLLENGITFGAGANTLDKRGGGSLILRGPSDHTGPTIVQSGFVILQDGGTLPNTSEIQLRGGELRVDNTTAINTNRINDAATITLGGGALRLTGVETIGNVRAVAGTTIVVNNPISDTVPNPLTLTGFTRQTGAIVQFQSPDSGAAGTGGAVGMTSFQQTRVGSRIFIPGQANTTQTIPGLLGNNNLDFIQYDGTTLDNGVALGVRDMRNPGSATSPQNYSNDLAEGSWTDAIILRSGTASTTLALTGDRALDAWKIEAAVTFTQNAFNLRIEGGGILAAGNTSTINGTGNLFAGAAVATAGTAELIIGGNNTLNINSVISNNALSGQNVALVKTGTGTLNLNGTVANTYTGGTYVNSGVLNTTVNNAFGAASNPIHLNGGTLQFNIANAGTNVDLGGLGHEINVNASSQITLDNGALTPTLGTDNNLAFGNLNINGPYTLRLFSFDSMDASFNGTHNFTGVPTIDMTQAGSGGNKTGVFTLNGAITGSGFNIGSSGAANDTTSVLQIGGGATDATPNTYNGKVTVLLGVGSTGSETDNLEIQLNKAAGTNAITGDLEINGGMVRLMQSNQIADASNIVINWGQLNMNVSATVSSSETVNSITLNGGSFLTNPITAASTPQANTLNVTGAVTVSAWDDVIAGASGGLTIGNNSTVTVGGLMTINNLGRVHLAEGATAAVLNLNGGLQLTGGQLTQSSGAGPNIVRLNSDVTTLPSIHPARIGNSTDSDTFLELNGVRMFSVADGTAGNDLELGTVIRNSTAPGATAGGIYKTGTGTMQIQGGGTGNSYTGDTTVSQGTVVLFKSAGVNAIPANLFISDGNGPASVVVRNSNQIADAADVTVGSTGVLDLQSFNTSETVRNLGGAAGGVTKLGPSSALTVNITANTTYGGSIVGGGAVSAITKNGSAKWTLSGNSEYSGDTIVNAGTLEVNGFVNGSTIRVNASATLQGTGMVSDVVLNSGSTFAPGNSPGIITTRNVAALTGSFTNIEIGGLTAGNGAGFHDRVVSLGTVSLGSTLSVSLVGGYVPNELDKFLIWTNDLADPVSGTFTGLPEGATFPVPETADPLDFWRISYVENSMAGASGNDIRIQYLIPEPGTAALAAVTGLLALARRRRRK